MVTVLYEICHVPFSNGKTLSYDDWKHQQASLPLATIFVGDKLEYLFTSPNKEHVICYSEAVNVSFHINKNILKLSTISYYNCNKIWNELNA